MGKRNFDQMVSGGASDGTVATVKETSEVQDAPQMQVRYSSQSSLKDVKPLNLRLAQFMTPEVQDNQAKAGQWLLAGFDPADEVVIVPMGHARPRRYDEGQADSWQVLCQSPDGEVGQGPIWKEENLLTMHLSSINESDPHRPTSDGCHDCPTCPFAQWHPDPKRPGKNSPPACNQWDEFLAWSVTHNFPVILRLKGRTRDSRKAPDAIKNLSISRRGYGNFSVRLTHSMAQNDRGKFAVPEVRLTDMDEETQALIQSVQGEFLSLSSGDVPNSLDTEA